MPDAFQTLAHLITINDANLADLNVSDILDDAPVMARLASDVASNGTQHKYVKETAAPVVGFRTPGTGRENTKSTDTLVTVTLKLLDASVAVDKALADEDRRGTQAYIAREARRHLKAAFFKAEQQFINGTGSDASGFTGLADALGFSNAMTVSAGGITADTASSVYLIRTNADGNDCSVITGNDGNIEMGEAIEQAIEDAANGGRFPGYFTSIMGWLGLQIGSAYSVGRICNITEDSGKGLTDDLIYTALEKFPAARMPNLIIGSRRSVGQLRNSRTATNATGAAAPWPTMIEDIPIVTTDGIGNTEALLN